MTKDPLSVGTMNVSRETLAKLTAYGDLISKWTKTINLVAPASVPDLWDRHIVDSAQIYEYGGDQWSSWTDIGSGGGLPGLVIAILDPKNRPLTLIESDTRKALFLNTVRRELNLNVTVLNDRIEHAGVAPSDVLSARALAPLASLCEFTPNLLKPTGKALFSKGSRYEEELDVARKTWHFDCTAHESQTNPDARVLELTGITRRES